MSPLCSIEDVKLYFSITSSSEDSVLTALIAAASADIEQYCNRTFAQAAYTETRNGNGGDRIGVRQWPIVSVQSVTVDGLIVPLAANAVSDGVVFSDDAIYIRNRGRPGYPSAPWCFARGVQNVVLQYTAGYQTIPADLNQACVEFVGWKRAKRSRIDKKNETLGSQQTQGYDLSEAPASVLAALRSYRLPMIPP
jgi:hypothetical protein